MTWKRQCCWIGVLFRELEMQAFSFKTDLPHYYEAGVPVFVSDYHDPAGRYDKLLPQELPKQKSEEQKEVDRHAYYFKFADDAKTKLDGRGLWVKKTDGSNEFEARPDARERLKKGFSEFLTSFVSFGVNNEVVRPKDLASGLVSSCIGGTIVIDGFIFTFNKIVSGLRKSFPASDPYFDQAGKLSYQLASAIHTLAATIQPVIHQAIPFQSNEIILAVLVTVEILLGFYATTTATEASLARNMEKSEILSKLINNKENAKNFFNKSRNSEVATAEEAGAYEQFMAAISKLDKLSGESAFGTLVAATTAVKETLWLSGSVVGNETAYKNLENAEIAIDGVELVGTTIGEIGIALVANIIDVIHGVVVFCRCKERIGNARGIKNNLLDFFRKTLQSESKKLIAGLGRVINLKIQDEEFEQGFSVARALKAIMLMAAGIVVLALIACAVVYTFPISLVLGIVSGLFFLILIARTIRMASRTKDNKAEEDAFNGRKLSPKGASDLTTTIDKSPENKFDLLYTLSFLLVDQKNLEDKNESALILAALNFNEVEINILKSLAQSRDDRAKQIEMVCKQLTRMLELKIVGA